MDLTEPEPQFRERKQRTVRYARSAMVRSILMAVMVFFVIGFVFFSLGLIGIGHIQLFVFALFALAMLYLIYVVLAMDFRLLSEVQRQRPISAESDRLTLNTRYTFSIDKVQGIDCFEPSKIVRFRSIEPYRTVLIFENEFVKAIIEKYKDRWSVNKYEDNIKLLFA